MVLETLSKLKYLADSLGMNLRELLPSAFIQAK
jgi:hypothetical protein